MNTVNFTDFTFKTPTSGDFLVGYNADGSAEYRTTVDALMNSSGSSGDSLATVLNYLSTNNVALSTVTINNNLVIKAIRGYDVRGGGTSFINISGRDIVIADDTTAPLLSGVGLQNLIIGDRIAPLFLDGYRNIFLGSEIANNATSPSDNIVIGHQSLTALSIFNNNIVIGNCSVQNNTSNASVIIGNCAFPGGSSGFNTMMGYGVARCASPFLNGTVMIGFAAGECYACEGGGTTGSLLIGTRTGQKSLSGCYNVMVGSCVGLCQGGVSNVMIGTVNMGCKTVGNCNLFIGAGSSTQVTARSVTTGSNNVYLGAGAARGATTGSNNVAIGYNSAFCLRTGMENVFIGGGAGFNTEGDDNTYIGYGAGAADQTGYYPSKNIAIGTGAYGIMDGEVPGLSGIIAIGYNAKPTNHNQLVLGSDVSPLSTVADTTLTNQTSSLIINLNGVLSKIPLLSLAASYIGLNTGNTIYVDAGVGTDTRTGLSKYDASKPFLTIAAAVSASIVGDLVWVRNGSYTITSTIDLNSKGNIYFEPNTTVVVPNTIVAFTYSTNSASAAVSIDGQANFFLQGTGDLIQKSGASTMFFSCKSILDLVPASPSSKTLFSCTGGIFFIEAEAITTPAATIFFVNDSQNISSRMSVDVPYVIGGNVIDVTGNSTTNLFANFTGEFWTLGGTIQPIKVTGSAAPSIMAKSAIYRVDGSPFTSSPVIRLISTSTAIGNGLVVRSGATIFDNNGGAPLVTMEGDLNNNSSTKVAFKDTMFTSFTNMPCISADRARDVYMTTCYANVSAHTNVNILGGTLNVDTDFNF